MIKFVYFDVGGVVMNDFSGTNKWEQFRKDFNFTEEYWKSIEPDLCVGKIDSPLVIEFVKRFEKNEFIWPIIQEITKYCRIGLLTNMYSGMFSEIKKRGLLPDVKWNLVIDSSVEGFAKPDKEIYKIAQEKAGVKPGEILFIENTQKNLEIPKEMGWQIFLYDSKDYVKSSEQLKTYFSQMGLY